VATKKDEIKAYKKLLAFANGAACSLEFQIDNFEDKVSIRSYYKAYLSGDPSMFSDDNITDPMEAVDNIIFKKGANA
jgi:hypothetical protein